MSQVTPSPFNPQGVQWQRVSNKLRLARVLIICLVMAIPVIGALVLLILLPTWWTGLILGVLAAFTLWMIWLAYRQVPAIGYFERDEDLIIVRGIMFKSLVVVPYGRMQQVDVEAGPLDRKFGIAKVTLHTASLGSNAVLPGLLAGEAARLRDRLASRGESRLAGL